MNQTWTRISAFLFATAVALAAMSACQETPRSPQSFEESVYIATEYATGMARSVNLSYEQQLLTKEQQLAALDLLEDAHNSLQAATDAYRTGDFRNAETRLDLAEGVLRTVALILARVSEGETL